MLRFRSVALLAYIRALITMPAAIAGPAKAGSEKPMWGTGLKVSGEKQKLPRITRMNADQDNRVRA